MICRGGGEEVKPGLGISHPTHPILGKFSQKKLSFFGPSLTKGKGWDGVTTSHMRLLVKCAFFLNLNFTFCVPKSHKKNGGLGKIGESFLKKGVVLFGWLPLIESY